MDQTDQLINVGTAYLKALSNLKENHPQDVTRILDIFDKVHPNPGYHFGIYIEEPWEYAAPTHACDQSWFHCYQGEEEPIMRRPYKSPEWKDGDSDNMRYIRFTFEMFNYLTIEPSAMGAWQAYLLCISKTLLPFSGSLYYTKRKLIIDCDQLRKATRMWMLISKKLLEVNEDISPYVLIEGNQTTVSCCYWNPWRGLIREHAPIIFENNKVKIGNIRKDTLYKYDCGLRF